jgi:hypothetical protein
MPNLRTFLPSILRTFVPLLVGYFGAWPVATALGLSDNQVTSLVTVGLTGGYYLVVRLAERYVLPQAGWLLGWAAAPVYVSPKDSGVAATPTQDVARVLRSQ